jgi:DNA-nicking Smr family endonuclease
MLNLALLKGMEEGSRFFSLPTNNGLLNSKKQPIQVNTGGKLKNRRRTLQQDEDDLDEAETSRNSKLMVPEPEETGEMVDRIALNVFSSCLSEIQSLRLTIGGEQVENNTRTGTESRSKTNKKNGKYRAHKTMDLHTMLLHCAQAVGMNDR